MDGKEITKDPKKRIKLVDYPDEVESDKWRNLYFDKSGKSYRGQILFPTEGEAKAFNDSLASDIARVTLDGKISPKDYSHAIQMPVKE